MKIRLIILCTAFLVTCFASGGFVNTSVEPDSIVSVYDQEISSVDFVLVTETTFVISNARELDRSFTTFESTKGYDNIVVLYRPPDDRLVEIYDNSRNQELRSPRDALTNA